jgi:hypothetical protein
MLRSSKIFFLFFLLASAGFLKIDPASAQSENSGFSINPFFQDITLDKNQSGAPFQLEVANNNKLPAVLRLSVLDFGALDESGGVAFLGGEGLPGQGSPEQKYGLASWISLENDTLVIGPGEKQFVKGTIQNKESLSPGGHYGAIFFKTEKGSDASINNQNNVTLDPSFASLLFVRKIGGEIYGLQLSDENTSSNLFRLPNTTRLRFQNTGNVHVTPRGMVEFFDPLGRLVSRGIINSESGIILPETFRVFPTPMRTLTLAFLPGRYKISTAYRYDGQDSFFGRNSSFYFIPPIFFVIVLMLAGGILVFWRWRGKAKAAK